MNLQNLKEYKFATVEQTLTFRDSIIYALGLGYGFDPNDRAQLQFVYEDGLKAVPSDVLRVRLSGLLDSCHLSSSSIGSSCCTGEHYYEIHRPIPTEGKVVAQHRIVGVEDKGSARGAVVSLEKQLYDSSGTLLARIEQTNFCRGDGGCGNFGQPPKERAALPDGTPDAVHEIKDFAANCAALSAERGLQPGARGSRDRQEGGIS
jgi:hypothetical protein